MQHESSQTQDDDDSNMTWYMHGVSSFLFPSLSLCIFDIPNRTRAPSGIGNQVLYPGAKHSDGLHRFLLLLVFLPHIALVMNSVVSF
jgi:hypothetical protein